MRGFLFQVLEGRTVEEVRKALSDDVVAKAQTS